MPVYQVSFQVSTEEPINENGMELALEDLLKTAVCPTLDLTFHPLSHSLRKVYS
jgi:hypothetical protein